MTPHDDESYESREQLRRDLLDDEEFRYGYAESFLNTFVAAQIKALREQRKMTQADLAEAIGTQQAGVSRLENVNYSAWKTETLRRIARALKVRLKISFETFGPLLDEVERFGRESLKRKLPSSDPMLNRVTPQYVAVAQTWDGSPRNIVNWDAAASFPAWIRPSCGTRTEVVSIADGRSQPGTKEKYRVPQTKSIDILVSQDRTQIALS